MKKILLLLLLFSIFSCSKDDEPTIKDEDLLTGTWNIHKTKTYHFVNGELDSIQETIYEVPYSTLTFDSNKTVTYSNDKFTQPITGTWVLSEKLLFTDLHLQLSASTGYGTRYFFPENTISLLTQSTLILQSPMSLEHTFMNGDKIKHYTETYLEK